MANQLHETPVPHVRLTQPLPPLPLSNMPPQLSIATHIPYRDDPEEEEIEVDGRLQSELSPPGYEPMFNYLRSQQRPNVHPPLYNNCQTISHATIEIPYRDEPFIISIVEEDVDDGAQPPPSYTEIYNPNEIEMRNLLQTYDLDGTPAEQTEEICKWVVAMLLIGLTIAGVGTAFNWGQPNCQWPNNKSSWRC